MLGGALTVWSDHNKQRGEKRAAARLVDAELAATLQKIRLHSGDGPASSAASSGFETPAWKESRGTLARTLKPGDWGKVRDAVGAIDAFRAIIEAENGKSAEASARLTRLRIDSARAAQHEVEAAREALRLY